MDVRVAITGTGEDGKAVFVADEARSAVSPAALAGNEILELWGSDAPPPLPNDGAEPSRRRFFPPVGGLRFVAWSIPPSSQEPPEIDDLDAAVAECDRLLPGMGAAVTDPDGMHATDTIDCLFVVEGEVELRLDSGEARTFAKGDCIVQNGTNHTWHNPGVETCVLLTAFFGAERLPVRAGDTEGSA